MKIKAMNSLSNSNNKHTADKKDIIVNSTAYTELFIKTTVIELKSNKNEKIKNKVLFKNIYLYKKEWDSNPRHILKTCLSLADLHFKPLSHLSKFYT